MEQKHEKLEVSKSPKYEAMLKRQKEQCAINNLEDAILLSRFSNDRPDMASWTGKQGVLLTREDAEIIQRYIRYKPDDNPVRETGATPILEQFINWLKSLRKKSAKNSKVNIDKFAELEKKFS